MKRIILILMIALNSAAYAQTKEQLLGKAPVSDSKIWENRDGFILQKEVYVAYDKMAAAAAKDGVNLYIVSAYRGFDRQKGIWERKWNAARLSKMKPKERALDILQYSSMPGTSRHHWGTDIDLVSVDPAFFDQPKGKKIYKWLVDHASEYGFFQPYTEGRTKGYATEKWHWSYSPISDKYMEKYLELITYDDIAGFKGAAVAKEIEVIDGWVKL